jgi:hypothetical protein
VEGPRELVDRGRHQVQQHGLHTCRLQVGHLLVAAHHAHSLVPPLGQQLPQPEPDLAMPSHDDDAHLLLRSSADNDHSATPGD